MSLPTYQTDRIQIVLSDAARLIFGGSRRVHVTQILRHRLHWLRASHRIEFKVTLLLFKGINNLTPDYITSYCISRSTNQRRSTLRSADKGNLIEPKTATEFGKRSFAFPGPHLWSKLPINSISWTDTFKYLGVVFNAGSKLTVNTDVINRKFYTACNCLLGNTVSLNEILRINLLDSYCLLILQYATAALKLNKSQSSELNACWKFVYRKMSVSINMNQLEVVIKV